MSRRLRIVEFLVQPVAVWDDGENLTPARNSQGEHLLALSQVPTASLAEFVDEWPSSLATVQAQLDAQADPPPD